MTKEELALEVIDRLKKEYPDAGCTLDYDQAWKLLVSVRLAAQCTDARVNVVVEDLYAKYPDVASLAAAEPEEIRIGLVDGIKDPKKVEMALWKIIPPEEGSDFCHRLVYHGREVCTARTKPYCDKCCLEDICQKNI